MTTYMTTKEAAALLRISPQTRSDETEEAQETEMNRPLLALLLLVALAGQLACVSAAGVPFGATLEGYISTRGVTPMPALPTFTIWEPDTFPSIDKAVVYECLQRHMESLGSRLVGPEDDPAAVVTFRFSTGGPSGFRDTWGDGSASTAVWSRQFTVYVFDGTVSGAPKALWYAEIRSRGPTTSPGPLSLTFLDQAFQRFGRSVSNEGFLVLANHRCTASGPFPLANP
jgi:hypothetical protein